MTFTEAPYPEEERQPSVLIWGNDPPVIEQITSDLESQGYEVTCTEDQEWAIFLLDCMQQIGEPVFDRIILVVTQGLDGYDILAWVRNRIEPRPWISVVLREMSDSEDWKTNKFFPDRYVVWPCESNDLFPRVNGLELEDFKQLLFHLADEAEDVIDELERSEGELVYKWVLEICQNWEEIAKERSHKEQNKGLWRIGGYPIFAGWWLGERVYGFALSQEQKVAFLHAAKHVTLAIPNLFGPDEPMENAYFMWWDSLSSDVTDPDIADVGLEVLADLSRDPDERVQYAALHGLGHLQHPERPAVIDEFIRRHPEWMDNPWILQCREGTVM